MSNARFIKDFHQLCCLGVNSRELMPHLIREVENNIPTIMVSFQWTNGNGNTVDYYHTGADFPLELQQRCLDVVINGTEAEYGPTTRDFLSGTESVINYSQRYARRYHNSSAYDEVHRPIGIYHFTRAATHDGQRATGLFHFCRSRQDPDFSENELSLIQQLLPLISHAVSADNSHPGYDQLTDGEFGQIVVTPSAGVEYCDAEGQQFLNHMIKVPLRTGHNATPKFEEIVAQLLRKLNHPEEKPAPPALRLRTLWGHFTLRATWLRSNPAPESKPMISIQVQHHLPLPLRLWQRLQESPLSSKQKEIGLLLTQGLGREEIARRLGQSPHTITTHVRQLYLRLHVSNREELLKQLLTHSTHTF
ncbi:MAG: LuxR C-terminal-related transcriptional regulator [Gammaproteobacteria bacterium]|nr:LuxR C-terminal-related transcriptional regulator [Gammaproteobacteria bacterium]